MPLSLRTAIFALVLPALALSSCTEPEVEPSETGTMETEDMVVPETPGNPLTEDPDILVPDADPELRAAGTPLEAFLNSCRATLTDSPSESDNALEACECAAATARDRMSPDAYEVFLLSFLPNRDELMDALMAQGDIDVDAEQFSMDMLTVMEDCGFGDIRVNADVPTNS